MNSTWTDEQRESFRRGCRDFWPAVDKKPGLINFMLEGIEGTYPLSVALLGLKEIKIAGSRFFPELKEIQRACATVSFRQEGKSKATTFSGRIAELLSTTEGQPYIVALDGRKWEIEPSGIFCRWERKFIPYGKMREDQRDGILRQKILVDPWITKAEYLASLEPEERAKAARALSGTSKIGLIQPEPAQKEEVPAQDYYESYSPKRGDEDIPF